MTKHPNDNQIIRKQQIKHNQNAYQKLASFIKLKINQMSILQTQQDFSSVTLVSSLQSSIRYILSLMNSPTNESPRNINKKPKTPQNSSLVLLQCLRLALYLTHQKPNTHQLQIFLFSLKEHKQQNVNKKKT